VLIAQNLQLFWLGLKSYFRAFFFIIRYGFIFYLVIPFVLLFIIYRYGYVLQNNVFEPKLDSINSLVWYLIFGLVEVTIGMVLMHFAKYMVVAILSPLLAHISERTERILTGEKQKYTWSQFKEDVIRAFKLVIRNLMWYYIYFVTIQLIAYIFWEKPSESPLQWLIVLIASYYYGFSFLDYVNERRRRNVSESIIFIRKHSGLAISIGLFYYLMIFVPVDLRIFFEYTLSIQNTLELIRQLFWWILAASAPIFGIVSATLAMYEIDKPFPQNELELIEEEN
jgi:CysZ protein